MSMTDPIADMLTRIRNSIMAKHKELTMPCSRLKGELLSILKKEGYIKDFAVTDGDKKIKRIKVELKYGAKNKGVITELKRISKPGKRVYVDREEIPKVMGGLGIAVISTSKGLLTDKEARKLGVGGELICTVF